MDDAVQQALERLATLHGRSLEEEAREMLGFAAGRDDGGHGDENVAVLARRLFGPENGVDLGAYLLRDVPDRPPLDFSGDEFGPLDDEPLP